MINYAYLDIDYDPTFSDPIPEYLSYNLAKYGMSLDNFSGMAFSLDNVKNFLSICPNNLVFVKLSTSFDQNEQLKKYLCECFDTFLTKNTANKFAIESYLRLCQSDIANAQDFEKESLIPDGAEPLNSDMGFVQGYMLNYKSYNFCFLPPKIEQVKDIVNNRLPSIFARLYKTPTEFIYLKTFGLNREQIMQQIKPFVNNSLGVSINIAEKYTDALISIGYDIHASESEVNNFVSQICETLRKHLYATEDSDIFTIALDMMRLTGKKLALVESLTIGKCFGEFAKVSNGKINDSIGYFKIINNISDLIDCKGVDRDIVSTKGLCSVESTYEISTAVINETGCDLVLSSLAEYNETSEQAIAYLAVGDQDGIHIYKQTIKGDKSVIGKLVAHNMCFYLIRKLKQNDLIFDQTLANM